MRFIENEKLSCEYWPSLCVLMHPVNVLIQRFRIKRRLGALASSWGREQNFLNSLKIARTIDALLILGGGLCARPKIG